MLTEWIRLVNVYPGAAAGALFASVVVTVAIRALLHRTGMRGRLDSSLALLAVGLLFGAAAALGRLGDDGAPFLYAYAAFVAGITIALVRVTLILFVDFYLRERKGAGVSTIVRDVGSVVTYFLIILLVLRFTLDINIASLVATSAVLTAIIGLALQDVLGGVISGLVLELEAPFEPGDWIRVGTYEGQVLETGWRTTKIRTRVNEVITLPNTYLSREPVVNYSRPDPLYGDTLYFEAAYEAPPHLVKQAVMAVLAAEPAVKQPPIPEVWTSRYNSSGIEHAVRYWLTEFGDLYRIRDRILSNVWYALRRAGVRIPFPARDLFVHAEAPTSPLERGDTATTLSRVSLFAPLGDASIRTLAEQVHRQLFGRGEAIVREGDAADSFYVIEQGAVDIVIGRRNGGAGRPIAQLGVGDFFGEMSLLAGEPRSATVIAREDVAVLEVCRAAFQCIVSSEPEVLEPISQIAARRSQDQQVHRRADEPLPSFASDPAAQRLMNRIKAFFHI